MSSVADRLFEKYKDRTMCNRETFVANIELARRFQSIPGAIVECGVWRGGMIAAIAEVLGDDRHYVLADSFQGLPRAQPIDGEALLNWQAANSMTNCRASAADAVFSMQMAGISNFRIVRGWFDDSLSGLLGIPIAVLRLDADLFSSTLVCLERLFDLVAVGGVIVIDDYYVWDGCARAVHAFLGSRNRAERIRVFNGVAYIVVL